ncbi:MAG: Transposase IS66 family protein [Candidatus Hydrogenedentes bacterium ADurb.Bin101]|nr:MAG: Transposase IS66 family protein [Candidatus Hydrogenedentes bacterium ADurb.Bin101]
MSTIKKVNRRKFRGEFRGFRNPLFRSLSLNHPTAEVFRQRLLGKEKNQWFAFLRHPGVPPTNNHAEQSIRPIVIMRKTSFGTRSQRGSQRHGILQSLTQTAKRQGKDIRSFLKTVLTEDTATAQKELYRNKSDP